jgi:tetratricopeptide (TPR) repeat protein
MFPQLLLAAVVSVRPISDAEQAAVQVAARYLEAGPAGITGSLSPDSPLARFPAATQLQEIETRLGPAEEAQWELQTVVPALKDKAAVFTVTYPSGLDDHVVLDMTRTAAGWRVRDMRFLAQKAEAPAAAPAAPQQVVTQQQPAPFERFAPRTTAVFFVLVALVLTAVSVAVARMRGFARALMAVAAAALALALIPRGPFHASVQASLVPAKPDERLAPLLPLRRAVASGEGIAEAYRTVDRGGDRGSIADLWKVQSDLLQANTEAARSSIRTLRSSADRPLAPILLARLALLENDEVAAILAYEQAVSLGPGRDALWIETADAMSGLGFDDRAEGYFKRLARIGSRDADVYYSLAAIEASLDADDHLDGAEKLFRTAWSQRPVERAQVINAGMFWSMLRRPGISALINLAAASEPLVLSTRPSIRPIALPPGATARTSGEYLQVEIGRQRLLVPGGAQLAPVGTPVAEASEWAREEEGRRLADFEPLSRIGVGNAAFAQPALRQRIIGTVSALAGRGRWFDVVRFTDTLTPAAENIPPSVFFLRSVGLQRLGRDPEATTLLLTMAKSPVLQRKRDAAAFEQLAELFAAQDLHEAAIRLYDRAQAIRANPFIDDRVRQILMNQRLATRYGTVNTPNFELKIPLELNAQDAAVMGEILEAELARLQSWIPVPSFKKVVVNVIPWEEFRGTYTGSDFILGFYNGKITVPFAGADPRNPQVRVILGHELAHAMIAQLTSDRAPRWFQEGLAQRVELRQFHENAFNMYADDTLLPLTLLDPVLHSSPDPGMIGEAYIVAQTNIRFIETCGPGAIRGMLKAYGEGATTDEAIARVCGMTPVPYDTKLREWGRVAHRVFENPPEKEARKK